MRAVALLLLLASPVYGADPCRDAAGKFTACPEIPVNIGDPDPVPEPTATPPPPVTPPPQRLRFKLMGGAITSIATDTEASLEPLASLGIEAMLSESVKGPSLEVQADLTALPGEALNLSDPLTFNALEMHVGISQPLPLPLLFGVYAEGGFASRLATSSEPANRLPGWASFGFLFRTADRAHSLRVGIGPDERLSGEWAASVHIRGQAKIGEKAGVSAYLVGSLIRALDLSGYGYQVPSRDALRLGVSVGN